MTITVRHSGTAQRTTLPTGGVAYVTVTEYNRPPPGTTDCAGPNKTVEYRLPGGATPVDTATWGPCQSNVVEVSPFTPVRPTGLHS